MGGDLGGVMLSEKPRLVLASASPRRLELLAQINITPDAVIPADINEDPHPAELPRVYAERMAREKLAAVADQADDAFCLAADTVVACGRRILANLKVPMKPDNLNYWAGGGTVS